MMFVSPICSPKCIMRQLGVLGEERVFNRRSIRKVRLGRRNPDPVEAKEGKTSFCSPNSPDYRLSSARAQRSFRDGENPTKTLGRALNLIESLRKRDPLLLFFHRITNRGPSVLITTLFAF